MQVLEGFRSLGAAHVGIAEGPGHRRITLDLAEAAGYFRVIPDFDTLFTDLNLDECSKVRLVNPKCQTAGGIPTQHQSWEQTWWSRYRS